MWTVQVAQTGTVQCGLYNVDRTKWTVHGGVYVVDRDQTIMHIAAQSTS